MEVRPRLTPEEYNVILEHRNNKSRVLVIGDLHSPFIKEGYLEFCQSIQQKYNCNEILFTGDLVDNHASGYHETDPDGHSAGQELEFARDKILEWEKVFPKAKVCIGNHDLLPARKAFTAGLSNHWIKSIKEVLEVAWEFGEEFEIDGILYIHGTACKAHTRAQNELVSIVQGHYHSESYIRYFVGLERKIFAMQIGCGVDRRAYAMAYGKHFRKQHINCGVVIDGLPILEYMILT